MISGIVAKRALQDYENERRAIFLVFWFNATTTNITSYYLLNAYFVSVPGRGLCNVLPNSIFLTTPRGKYCYYHLHFVDTETLLISTLSKNTELVQCQSPDSNPESDCGVTHALTQQTVMEVHCSDNAILFTNTIQPENCLPEVSGTFATSSAPG